MPKTYYRIIYPNPKSRWEPTFFCPHYGMLGTGLIRVIGNYIHCRECGWYRGHTLRSATQLQQHRSLQKWWWKKRLRKKDLSK